MELVSVACNYDSNIEIGIRLAEGIRLSELLESSNNCAAWSGPKAVKSRRRSIIEWQNSSSTYYQWAPGIK